MTIQKKAILESTKESLFEDDDYYAVEKKRIADEAQKARRIHEEDVHTHITAMIPHYEDADMACKKLLLKLNNILVHRFAETGLVYWSIFQKMPGEIREYGDLFGEDLAPHEVEHIVIYFQDKKTEAENMVEMGFDEDGEEDDFDHKRSRDEDESDEDEDDQKDE